MKRCVLPALAMLVTGCDTSDREARGSANFDMVDAGKIGSGRTATYLLFVTDRATGCQYLAAGWQDLPLTPRLGRDGRPMCPNVQNETKDGAAARSHGGM